MLAGNLPTAESTLHMYDKSDSVLPDRQDEHLKYTASRSACAGKAVCSGGHRTVQAGLPRTENSAACVFSTSESAGRLCRAPAHCKKTSSGDF